MTTNILTKVEERQQIAGGKSSKLKITVFHCFNAINNLSTENIDCEISAVKMPCSSMTRDVFLLRAFESGADAVAVLVCPEGTCRYIEGNIRARKRVEHVKKILDEIGIDNRRLNIFNINEHNQSEVDDVIAKVMSDLAIISSFTGVYHDNR